MADLLPDNQQTAAPSRVHPINVTKNQIKQLVNNFFTNFKRHDRALDKKKDASSIWFNKSCIDKLFELHPGASGLRIYFGAHDGETVPVSRPEYVGQMMVVLVATKDTTATGGVEDEDMLTDQPGAPEGMTFTAHTTMATTTTLDTSGSGSDNGKLCPPDTGCGCVIN
jgi:hypothetical protein